MIETRSDLEELVRTGESARLELTRNPSARVVETLAAMANSEGGTLVVGAGERGELLGLPRDEGARLITQLAVWLADRVTPPLPAETRTVELGADRVAIVVEVAPTYPPHMLQDGRILGRVGATTRPITPAQILAQGRRQGILPPFDALPVTGATIADLAPERITAFMTAASPNSPGDPNTVLRAFSLVVAANPAAASDLTPTLTGLLVLGRNPQRFLPQAFIKIARHSGSTPVAPVIDTDEIVGTVPEQIDRLQPALARFLRTASSVQGLTRREWPEYPPGAIRELVINALVHRDYAAGTGPVIIRLFTNRVEITDPGHVEAATFGQLAERPPALQNPTLSRSLRALGYLESLGVGLARAAAELRAAGHGVPVLEQRGNNVVMVVHTAKQPDEGRNATRDAERVLEKAMAQAVITKREVRELLGVSDATATRRLSDLAERGQLARHSRGRGVYYTYVGGAEKA